MLYLLSYRGVTVNRSTGVRAIACAEMTEGRPTGIPRQAGPRETRPVPGHFAVIWKYPRRLRAQHASVCSVQTRFLSPVDATSKRVASTPCAIR